MHPGRMLATDLDGTFIGDDDAMLRLWGDLEAERVLLVFSTGRHLPSIEAFYAEHLTSIQPHCVGAKSLLEVGCGTGRLLELMRDTGLDCEGVELDPERAETARLRSGCKIHTAPVEELRTEKTYDVITMINVLSHIPSLPGLVAAIGRLLSGRGRRISPSF